MLGGGRNWRFRPMSKIQVVICVLVGVLIMYHVIPLLLKWGSGSTVAKTTVVKQRVRDERAISFTDSGRGFIVEGEEMRIMSGAIHYFRVVPLYWKDRLMKLKAAGLNTVETYMPWNLHEPTPGKYDFTGILDVVTFLTIAKSLGLHAIVRPGPYICSEWDLGGLPPWLLHDPDMILRSTYPPYLEAVDRYFEKVFEVLSPQQSVFGGPIIAFQIENEFAQYHEVVTENGIEYMKHLYNLMKRLGAEELLFTSDAQAVLPRSLKLRPADDVMLTINFMRDKGGIQNLSRVQPDKPVMIMEFWSGWFDHWNGHHHTDMQPLPSLIFTTRTVLEAGASLNYYVFHGGTNFGFMNGANSGGMDYKPTVTSYDYDAPLAENGDITEKYREIRNLFTTGSFSHLAQSPLPPIPPNIPTFGYGEVKMTLYLPILSTLQYLPKPHISDHPIPMELLPLNGCGQCFGFVLYRSMIPAQSTNVVVESLRDYGTALLDFKPLKRLMFFDRQSFALPQSSQNKGSGDVVLDLLVENAGRVNYGYPLEGRKGILGKVEVDGKVHTNWKIYSLEFKSSFIESIDSGGMWQRTPPSSDVGPALYKGTFNIQDEPKDTYIDMEGWGKGVVFINGANLGRYWNVGPQGTLYIPAPVLKKGINKVMIFEVQNFKATHSVLFRRDAIIDMVTRYK